MDDLKNRTSPQNGGSLGPPESNTSVCWWRLTRHWSLPKASTSNIHHHPIPFWAYPKRSCSKSRREKWKWNSNRLLGPFLSNNQIHPFHSISLVDSGGRYIMVIPQRFSAKSPSCTAHCTASTLFHQTSQDFWCNKVGDLLEMFNLSQFHSIWKLPRLEGDNSFKFWDGKSGIRVLPMLILCSQTVHTKLETQVISSGRFMFSLCGSKTTQNVPSCCSALAFGHVPKMSPIHLRQSVQWPRWKYIGSPANRPKDRSQKHRAHRPCGPSDLGFHMFSK